jgi:hypothetical protein
MFLERSTNPPNNFNVRCLSENDPCVEEVGQDQPQNRMHQNLVFIQPADTQDFSQAAERLGVAIRNP